MSIRNLYAFDFDHTVINENSDMEMEGLLVERMEDGRIPWEPQPKNWTGYMNRIFEGLFQNGVSIEEIKERVRALKPTIGMTELLLSIHPNDQKLIISDSNTFFIDTFLPTFNLPSPFHVITNGAQINDNLLQIQPYHPSPFFSNSVIGSAQFQPIQIQSSTSSVAHCCKLSCPPNLCKGLALEKFIEDHGPFERVFYIGDGGNDLCPAVHCLTETDVLFPREGYRLAKIAHKYDLKCKVKVWSSALEIQEFIEKSR